MFTHTSINVDVAIKELKKGNNLLKCSPNKAALILSKCRVLGQKYYCDCNNRSVTGECLGHETKL